MTLNDLLNTDLSVIDQWLNERVLSMAVALGIICFVLWLNHKRVMKKK